MTWADIPTNPPAKTLRQFSAAWLVFFLAFAAHQYFKRAHHQVGIALAIAAILVGSLGLLRPAAVRWVFVGWMVAAFPIGWVISQTMLLLMFYGIITPVALFLRLRGRDSLYLRRPQNAATFWLPKQTPTDVRSYLRQY
jgi:hypothetical protein